MSFTLNKSGDGSPGVVLLALHGKAEHIIHSSNPFPFEALLGDVWTSHTVLLDMDAIDYLDSAAVGWLIASQKSFRASGGQLILHSIQPQVLQLLTMLKFERVVPLAKNLSAARALAAPQAAVTR